MAFSTLIYYKQDQTPSSLCQDPHDVPVGLTQASGDQYIVYYNETQAISVGLGNNATLSELSSEGIQILADTSGSSPVPPGSYASGPFDGTQISDTVVFDQNLTQSTTTTCPVTASIVGFNTSSGSVTETNTALPVPIPVSLQNYPNSDVTVSIALDSGASTVEPGDITILIGTLTFANEGQQPFLVQLNPDAGSANEIAVFNLTETSSTGAILGISTFTLNIVDDEGLTSPNGNSIINVYYKSYDTINTLYNKNMCAGGHEVLTDINGTTGDSGDISGQYKLYYDSSFGSGLSLDYIKTNGIQLSVDDALLGVFQRIPKAGYISENPFDGSQVGTFDNYYMEFGLLGAKSSCTGNGNANPTTKSLKVYASPAEMNDLDGQYCLQPFEITLYYLYNEEFLTLEELIYQTTYGDAISVDVYFSDKCPPPNPALITDPAQPFPGGDPLDLLDGIGRSIYVGQDLTSFYLLDDTGNWFQSQSGSFQYGSFTSVPNTDPVVSPSAWQPWECNPIDPSVSQINLQYATTGSQYCSNPTLTTFYYFNGKLPLTFQQILSVGIPLFTDEQSAIDYYYCNSNVSNLAPNGFYGEGTLYYYEFNSSAIEDNLSPWLPTSTCLFTNPTLRTTSIKIPTCDVPSAQLAICEYPLEEIAVYYIAGVNLTLLQIAQNDVDLYTTPDGALTADNSKLILGNSALIQAKAGSGDTSIDQDEYFEYKTHTSGHIWRGGNEETTAGGVNTSMNPIPCGNVIRPNINLNEEISDGGLNTFYVFYSCKPSIPSQSSYGFYNYEFFLVDGLHRTGENSAISDLIVSMKNSGKRVISGEIKGSCQCIEYVHTLNTADIGTALSFLSNYYPNIFDVNPADIGIGSEQLVKMYSNCVDCGDDNNATLYQMPEYDTPEILDPGPNMDIEKNYKLDNVSKPLLRTNPKLSTNVKLVVDSSDNIYLDSFNANQNLSDSKYKRYELSKDSSYAYDLSRYYNSNNTPIDSTFEVLREYSDLSVHDQYRKQLEEEYQYGTKLNDSRLYDEEYRMLAPIWLDLNVPKKFVIYRVNDPNPELSLGDGASDKLTRVLELVKNSKIVKVFDLSKQSSIGKYIRSHVQDEFFPSSSLTITMEEGEKSTFNGIDLIKGGFVEKSEYIYNDFVRSDLAIHDANDFITDGFRRNKVASANLINLEFMFDDPSAEDYSVNRYFGLYVDDFESGVGEVAYTQNGIVKFGSIESYMGGSDTTYAIPEYRLLTETGLLAFAKIREEFYTLDPSNSYDAKRFNVSINATSEEVQSKLGVVSKGESASIISNLDADSDYIKFKIINTPETNDVVKISMIKKESVRFKVIKNTQGETIRIEDFLGYYVEFDTGIDGNDTWNNLATRWTDIESSLNGGTIANPPTLDEIKFYNRYDLSLETTLQNNSVVFTERSSNLVDNQLYVTSTGSTIIATDEIYTNVDPLLGNFFADGTGVLGKKKFTSSTFSSEGSYADIAFSLAGAIRNNSEFDAYNIGDDVYVKSKVNGYNLRNAVLLVGVLNQVQFIQSNNIDQNNILNLSDDILTLFNSYYLTGGNSGGKSVYVTFETADVINVGDYLPTKYLNEFNQILHIGEDTVRRNGEYKKLVLKSKNELKSKDYEIYSKNRITLGLFSAYDIYDMDFDFYDDSNSKLKELNLETSDNMGYVPYNYAIDHPPTGAVTLSPDLVIGPDFKESPLDYFANLLPLLQDEVPGEFQKERISTEYDRLKENYTKEYSTYSRIVPFINKWVLKDSMTVREEPYHLNTNEAFGRTNFSPDVTVEGRVQDSFTHEWFYIDKWPSYFTPNAIDSQELSSYRDDFNEGFSYINFVKDFEVTRSLFTSTQYDYFERFMVTEGTETNVEINDNGEILGSSIWSKTNLQKKYTIISGGSEIDFGSTVFKGLKYAFKKRKDDESIVASEFVKNTEFNGYRFSVLAKANTGAESNTVKYEFIKNDKFKFIVLFIEISIDDSYVEFINRKYLYELSNKIISSPVSGFESYVYADVRIDGAIDLTGVKFNLDGPYIARGIENSNGTLPLFTQQISPGVSESYGSIKIDYGQSSYTPNGEDIFINVVKTISNESIQLEGAPYYIDSNSSLKVTLNAAAIPLAIQRSATYTYIGGGANLYDNLFTQLSANYFYDLLKNDPNQVKYTTIDVSGTELSNRYSIDMEDGKEIIKLSNLVSVPDTDTPKAFKLSKKTIGYNIEESSAYYPFLIRHNGNYTVDLTPIVTFTDVYGFNKVLRDQREFEIAQRVLKEPYYKLSLSSGYEVKKSLAYYKRFNRLGVAFNVGFISDGGKHDADWGIIKNHFYHKTNEVNTLGVTKLSESSEYLPQYPLINEIAIDRRDINVFRSSWEDDYYYRSVAGGGIESVPGTISTIEEKSYVGSSAIKTKDSYSVYQFESSRVETESELDEILRNSNNLTNVVFFEDDSNIFADFYMDGLIAKIIGEDGLASTIEKFVDPAKSAGDKETVSDDVILYALNNMVPIYGIDSIEIYSRRFKGEASEIISTSAIDLLNNGGYKEDGGFTYRLHGKKSLNFRLIYNKQLGYSYSIRALIKIQS